MNVQEFVKTLTKAEREFLWAHVFRYAGVEGTTAKEQFKKLISYVLNFLDGSGEMEQKIYAKALQAFEVSPV